MYGKYNLKISFISKKKMNQNFGFKYNYIINEFVHKNRSYKLI